MAKHRQHQPGDIVLVSNTAYQRPVRLTEAHSDGLFSGVMQNVRTSGNDEFTDALREGGLDLKTVLVNPTHIIETLQIDGLTVRPQPVSARQHANQGATGL